jgi:alkylation response protein AidB-like acyl-CoA dehydrogenase
MDHEGHRLADLTRIEQGAEWLERTLERALEQKLRNHGPLREGEVITFRLAEAETRDVSARAAARARARAQAAAALREARHSIAGNHHLPEEVRRDVLQNLDQEIADLRRPS